MLLCLFVSLPALPYPALPCPALSRTRPRRFPLFRSVPTCCCPPTKPNSHTQPNPPPSRRPFNLALILHLNPSIPRQSREVRSSTTLFLTCTLPLTLPLTLNSISVCPLLSPLSDLLLLTSSRPSKNTDRLLRRQDCRSYISCSPSQRVQPGSQQQQQSRTSESVRFVQAFSHPPNSLPGLLYDIYHHQLHQSGHCCATLLDGDPGLKAKSTVQTTINNPHFERAQSYHFQQTFCILSLSQSRHCLSLVCSSYERQACIARRVRIGTDCARDLKSEYSLTFPNIEQILNSTQPAFIAAWSVRSKSAFGV